MASTRTFTAGLLAALALLVAGCGGSPRSTGGGPGESSASLLKGGTFVFASIDTDLSSAQWQTVDQLLRKFPDRSALLSYFTRGLAKKGLDYEGDVKPALGAEADLALADAGREGAAAVFLTKPADEDKFKDLLTKLSANQSQKPVYRKVGGWYVVARNEETIDRALKPSGGDSLADQKPFTDAMGELPDHALAKLYVNGAGIAGLLQTGSPAAGAAVPVLGLDKLEFGAAALSAQSTGLRLEGALKGEGARQLRFEPFSSKLVSSVPAGALAVLSFRGGALAKRVDDLRRNPLFELGVQQFQSQLGVSVDDLLDLLRHEAVLYVRQNAPFPEVTLLLEAPNEQQALDIVDRLMRHVAQQTQGKLTQSTEDGLTVRSLELERITFRWAAFAGKLVVTTGPNGISDLRSPRDKLPNDPSYTEARQAAGAPAENGGFLYVNLADAIPVVESYAAVSGGGLPAKLRDNLRPLRSLFVYGSGEGDVSRFTASLEVK
jgi:Protein of unknown function (DUF3352)